MKNLKVKIVNKSKHELPSYATSGSAGMDLKANIDDVIYIYPSDRKLIKTGIHIQLPEGYEAQIRPRSGLALKHGISVCNTPGTIDSDYTGEIGVVLINHGKELFVVKDGERIAQMVIAKYETVEWDQAESLDKTERGDGGFGHSGK